MISQTPPQKYQAITLANIARHPVWERLDPELRDAVQVVSRVLPFKTNTYVVEQLIDWDNAPDDPIFQLTFPQQGMLDPNAFDELSGLLKGGSDKERIDELVSEIRFSLNPHPAGQTSHNVPEIDGRALNGMQHKYRETVLFFPSHGQTCHAYCTFCFRWAQFVGMSDLKFAEKETGDLVAYLKRNPQVTDVLITGGDPLVMKASVLERYITPILDIPSVKTIRIGSKAPAYWPQRFVSDADSDDLLRVFEKIVDSDRHLAIMGHFSHAVELSTDVAREGIRRIRSTGANVRMQSPIIRRVNDDANAWVDLWTSGVRLGAIPYYMFVERDTGAKRYFDMPLSRCWSIFQEAYQRVSGISRTVRGPSMSCFPGKCHVLGVTTIGGKRAFVLEFLQARDPELVRRPFFAKFSPEASWFDQLEPFAESDKPFFENATEDNSTPLTIARESMS